MQLFPVGRTYDFMGKRRLFVGLSVLFVILSFVAMFVTPKPRFGTDFLGGTEVEIAFKAPTTPQEIRDAVGAAGFSRPDVIRVEDESHPHRYLVRVQEVSTLDEERRAAVARVLCVGVSAPTPECPEQRLATELKVSPGGDKLTVRFREPPDLGWIRERMETVSGISLRPGDHAVSVQNARDNKVEVQLKSKGDQLLDGLLSQLGADKVPDAALRVEWIGPKAGAQLRDAALKSIAIALVFVMAYIAFRFDLRFAPGAVIALMHDAIVTLGMLTVLQREVNLTTVAAVLTIVGYSVNDTVVVFDRVRENLGKLRGSTFITIINISLSEMLSRTVLTSMTTIVAMSAFFYWGTGTLKDFSLTLIIGMVLGTYSSIYVALPLTEWLDRRFFAKMMGARERKPVRKKVEAVV
jgi:preprotein translocase subunit SecF